MIIHYARRTYNVIGRLDLRKFARFCAVLRRRGVRNILFVQRTGQETIFAIAKYADGSTGTPVLVADGPTMDFACVWHESHQSLTAIPVKPNGRLGRAVPLPCC
jgi:hypothetical protein